MEILIAENPAFCYGVERAYKFAKQQKGMRIFTWGPLIHNPQIVAELVNQGIHSLEDFENLQTGDTVIIRAHGVSHTLKKKLAEKKVKIVDGTCPFVTKAHLIADNLNSQKRQLVILGDKNHPEIQGICEDFPSAFVIKEKAEIETLREKLQTKKLGILCQTTIKLEEAEEIVDLIGEINPEFVFENTICNATYAKQNSAKKLAQKVDAMLIVGGKNSNNTKMLQEICSKFCPSYLVSEVNEIQQEWFEGCEKVGITGGASTPMWLIEEVENQIFNSL